MSLSARLVKRFPRGQDNAGFVLQVEFEAAAEITILFGASGAGKSLTLDCIAGFACPDVGRVMLGESILFDADARVNVRPQDRNCGYVFQNYALFPHMTLRENLEFAAERRPRLERHRRVNEMIERFHLEEIAGRRPREVSGGQRQRCSIARALIAEPRALLFDEAARGLDAGLRGEYYTLLRELRGDLRIPILAVTHDLDEAVALGDRMLVYQAGRIVQSGAPQEVISRPASAAIASLVGHTNVLEAKILALDPGRKTSRLRIAVGDIAGPYLPGHLIGDRVMLFVRADDLRVWKSAGGDRLPVRLEGRVDHARMVELRFGGDLLVLVPRQEWDGGEQREWFVEFPPECLRLAGTSF